ncbi:hypothetical protein Ahy_B09g099204 [Arachis hypogaea]|uniref:F-box domain-containing protein n=1 Tax=Arachis hypogaea TaxID=3818 RepID=A0A444XU29_ARAHY|nr:hypothetical protein Ahy_B09g099204 [Arachis hypogaea]
MHLHCPSYAIEAEFQRRLFTPPSFIWYTNPLLRRPHQERQEERSSRNWLHLPVELILIIFEKLGAIEVLTTAQRVCMLWRTICKDPYTWRVINMRVVGVPKFMDYQLSSLCRRTIERSCGLLVDISIDYFATKDLLNHIANSSFTTSTLTEDKIVPDNFNMGQNSPSSPLFENDTVLSQFPSYLA